MIAHVSIPSRNPRSTAIFIAGLIDGEAFPFPVVDGAWVAVAADGTGTAVEVYADTMAHHPGRGEPEAGAEPQGPQAMPWEDQIHPDGAQLRPAAFHFAMSSPLADDEVLRRGRAAGFRAVKCERAGVFGLVEVWIDDLFLVEVLCGREMQRYADFMNPAGLARMFGPGVRPT